MFLSRSFSFSRNLCKLVSETFTFQSQLKRGFTPTIDSVNHFILFLSRAQKFNSIIHFFSQMKSNRIEGNSQTYFIIIRALLKLQKFDEAHHLINTQIIKSSVLPEARYFDSLIQGFCIKQKDPEKGLFVLKDCLLTHGILPSSFTFCSLIYSFSFQGKMGRAVEVLQLMTDDNVKYPFDNFVCSSVIYGFCKIGKPEIAIGFFENSVSIGTLRPNIVTYTTLVTALCMLGKINEVYDLVIRMENEGVAFDVVFYSNWICGYFREGSLLQAFLKHRQMVDKGVELDTISYTVLIDGFAKEGNVEKAVGILSKMIKDGLRPNLVTYTAIILGFCKKGKLEEAFKVFKKVEELGIEMDEFIYATLIDGICKKGDLHRVSRLLEEMEKKGIKPSTVTYNTIINGFCNRGRVTEAEEVSRRVSGDVVTYSTLLHAYVEEKNVKRMLETKEIIEEAGIQMDVIMCNILIKAMFMMGALEDAHALYEAMPEMDLTANDVTYGTMIDGYCKLGRIEEALEIFDEFRGTSIPSVACYICIINGLCKKGMVDMATEVFLELNKKRVINDVGIQKILILTTFRKEGIDGILDLVYRTMNLDPEINEILCNDVICFLCKRGFIEAATEVCMLTRRSGTIVQSKSYSSIMKRLIADGRKELIGPFLNVLVKEQGVDEPMVSQILACYFSLVDVTKALWFIKLMKENSSTAVSLPFAVLKKLIYEGRVMDAHKLFMEARDDITPLDVVDYSLMINGLCKVGYISKALELCAYVKTRGINLNIITINSIINSLCHQGCLVEAFRLFDSLAKIDVVPSEVTYAILIHSLCKEGLFEDAIKLFDRMIFKGLKPNTRIYNSFFYGYCKFGRVKDAMKFLDDLEVNSLKPDEFSISAFINGFYKRGDMEGALGLFFEYKRKGISPDFLGFLYLIRGLYTKGRMEEARSILREMLQSKSVLELLNVVHTGVESESATNFLVILCDEGNIQEAVAVLNEIGSIYFPVRLGSTDMESQIDFKMMEEGNYMGGRNNEFEFWHFQIASLYSNGDKREVNRLTKKMMATMNGDF